MQTAYRLLYCSLFALIAGCAPQILSSQTLAGTPGTKISLPMEYLVGWPRVEIGSEMMDWPRLKLAALNPERKNIPGEELIWIEDKVLQFTVPDLPPGEYKVTIYDDKGPPGDPIYSFLETTAYVIFPPVWPFVFRSNRVETRLQILPAN